MTRPSAAWSALGFPGKLALLTVGCAALALLVSSRHIVSALSTPAAKAPAANTADEQRKLQYAAAIDTRVRHVDGRSLFFVPSAPPPPPPPPPPPKTDNGPPPPPPPPSRYGGPTVIAMLNNAVWFENGQKLEIGQSSEADSVKVVSLDAPWSAVLEWKGKEFTVDLFKRDAVVVPPASESPATPPAATPPASAANETQSRLTATIAPSNVPPTAPNGAPAESDKE